MEVTRLRFLSNILRESCTELLRRMVGQSEMDGRSGRIFFYNIKISTFISKCSPFLQRSWGSTLCWQSSVSRARGYQVFDTGKCLPLPESSRFSLVMLIYKQCDRQIKSPRRGLPFLWAGKNSIYNSTKSKYN